MSQDDDPVEVAIGKLYQEFYKLRLAGKYQEEYDAMGTLINMLSVDRQHMRSKTKYGIKP